jgi:hypothetical protein
MRPVLRPGDYSGLDWVLPKIKPLLTVAFAAPQTPVKIIALPDRPFVPIRPPPSHLTAPKTRPGCDRRRWRHRGRAEQVQMIRHGHPAAHQPVIGLLPAIQQQGHDLSPRQQGTALFHAHRHKDHGGLVGKFQGRKMRQVMATKLSLIHRHGICYRQSAEEASPNHGLAGARPSRKSRRPELSRARYSTAYTLSTVKPGLGQVSLAAGQFGDLAGVPLSPAGLTQLAGQPFHLGVKTNGVRIVRAFF